MPKRNYVLVGLVCVNLLISVKYELFSGSLLQAIDIFNYKVCPTSQLFWILKTFIIKQPAFDVGLRSLCPQV